MADFSKLVNTAARFAGKTARQAYDAASGLAKDERVRKAGGDLKNLGESVANSFKQGIADAREADNGKPFDEPKPETPEAK